MNGGQDQVMNGGRTDQAMNGGHFHDFSTSVLFAIVAHNGFQNRIDLVIRNNKNNN
jgi:hypothetical protein